VLAGSAVKGDGAYGGGVAVASDRSGQSGHAFKGTRHPGRSARGVPGGRRHLTGGSTSASAPLMSGPRVIENSELKTLPNENS
jgi:hypothetical protein